MTSDLIAFITARLDEDERTTVAFRDGHDGPCLNYPDQDPEAYTEWDTCCKHIATAKASRYMDTAFGLREVEAKRRIVAAHPIEYSKVTDYTDCAACMDVDTYDAYPCLTMRLLALPYADHPDFRTEWRL